MKNQWSEAEAAVCGDDPLAMRVYSSRLIGREAALVLHGGGNTSVKAPFTDAARANLRAVITVPDMR